MLFLRVSLPASFLIIVSWKPVVKNPSANGGDSRNVSLIAGLGKSPGEGYGNPLQYSCLENLMDRGAWWTVVHRVTKSQTLLSDLTCTCTRVSLPASFLILSWKPKILFFEQFLSFSVWTNAISFKMFWVSYKSTQLGKKQSTLQDCPLSPLSSRGGYNGKMFSTF